MKKITYLVLIILASTSYADTLNLAQTQSLQQIQNDINSLNTQLAKQAAQPRTQYVGLDTNDPFGLMSKVQMPVTVLQAKNTILTKPLVIGGQLEADAQDTNGDNIAIKGGGFYQNGSNINLTKVEGFLMANINDETTGLIGIKNPLPLTTTNPVTLDRAFLIFGNLDKNPLSFMIGTNYLPFGIFNGNGPWDNTLSTNSFRTATTNQAIMNFSNNWLILNGGIYSSGTAGAPSMDYLMNGIAKKTWNNITASFGLSYLADVRGLNNNLGSAYALGGHATSSQPLTGGTNPAYDINASLGPAYLTALGEFDSTTRGASELGQSVGKMYSWTLGEQSMFNFYHIPTKFILTYSQTGNMSAVPMNLAANAGQNNKTATGIEHQWMVSATGEFWKNVYIGPEFDLQHLYNDQNSNTLTLDVTAYI